MVPITGGTISGAINATISAGLAYPAVYSHGNGNRNSSVEVEVPAIILYGTTEEEKVPYLIQLSGVGKLTAQVTRVVSPSMHSFSFPAQKSRAVRNTRKKERTKEKLMQ